MLLKLGAKVVNGDLNPPIEAPDSASLYRFIKTDVTSWADLKNLFKETLNSYGRIDHVFANAGKNVSIFAPISGLMCKRHETYSLVP